jgi:hypothetical protein
MTAVLAVVGVALSVVLAGIKVWESFMLRPQLTARFDWVMVEQVPVLRVAFANTRRRKARSRTCASARRRCPRGEGGRPTAKCWSGFP